MSSVVKVSLITELGLLPFKRYIQRKPDNYQEAVQKYTTQLGETYRLSLKEQRQSLVSQKRSFESETFRLDSNSGELNGITIERKSWPWAEPGDRVILLKHEETSDAAESKPLARGVVTRTTEDQIRIKFQEPIFKKPVEPKPENELQDLQEGPSKAEEATIEEVKNTNDGEKENTQETLIDFKIKFDSRQDDKLNGQDDSRFRLIEAVLMNFRKLKCHQTIQRSLLGFYDERSDALNDKARVLAFTELVLKLNNQQRSAIEHALKRRITLIEGPAGTGKTVVAAHIAANVARQKRGRVLVCSPIQETIDRLTELVDRVGGIQVVKLPSKAHSSDSAKCNGSTSGDESEASRSSRCHLDKLVDDLIYLQAYSRFKDIIGNNHEKLHAQAYRMVTNCPERRRQELQTKIISGADVVCCKIDPASISLLRGIEFDMLVLDDVQATSELDCLIAIMTKGIKQVTLLSDTRREIRLARTTKRSHSVSYANNATSSQVSRSNHSTNSLRRRRQDTMKRRPRPVSSLSDNISNMGTRISRPASPLHVSLEPGNLFERLLSVGLPTVDLRVQYRCHATISNFVIHHFYAGRLRDDSETNDKMSLDIVNRLMIRDESFSWLPNKKYLTALYRVSSNATNESCIENEPSKVIEERVSTLVSRLINDGVRKCGYTIGIIQNSQQQTKSSKETPEGIKRGLVDKFIGQECDFVILVVNRIRENIKSDQTGIGISTSISIDFRRSDVILNWVLTRARLGLFIVYEDDSETNDETHEIHGQHNVDCRSWQELVKYYAANDLIVD